MSSMPPTSLPALTAARVPVIHQLYPRARWMTRVEFRNGSSQLPSIFNIFVEDHDAIHGRSDWIGMDDQPVTPCEEGFWASPPNKLTFFHPTTYNMIQGAAPGENGTTIVLIPLDQEVLVGSGVLQAHGYLRAIPLAAPPSGKGAGGDSGKGAGGDEGKGDGGDSGKGAGGAGGKGAGGAGGKGAGGDSGKGAGGAGGKGAGGKSGKGAGGKSGRGAGGNPGCQHQ
jgi:hypothetical protein